MKVGFSVEASVFLTLRKSSSLSDENKKRVIFLVESVPQICVLGYLSRNVGLRKHVGFFDYTLHDTWIGGVR